MEGVLAALVVGAVGAGASSMRVIGSRPGCCHHQGFRARRTDDHDTCWRRHRSGACSSDPGEGTIPPRASVCWVRAAVKEDAADASLFCMTA